MSPPNVPPRQKTIITATGSASTAQNLWAPYPPSFPVRRDVSVTPLIDGKSDMEQVAEEVSNATVSIFIEGWDIIVDLRLTSGEKTHTLLQLLEDARKKPNPVSVYVLLANTGANFLAVAGPTDMPSTIEDRL